MISWDRNVPVGWDGNWLCEDGRREVSSSLLSVNIRTGSPIIVRLWKTSLVMENGPMNSTNFPDHDGSRIVVNDKNEEEEEDEELDEFDVCDCDGVQNRPDIIPYKRVYDPKEVIRQEGYFIPAYSVKANIVKVERDSTTAHLLSPYVYTIQVTHGPYQWQIERRYADFQHLDSSLTFYRTGSKIKSAFTSGGPIPELHHEGFGDLFDVYENESLEDAKRRTQQRTQTFAAPLSSAPQKPAQKDQHDGGKKHGGTKVENGPDLAAAVEKQRRKQAGHGKIPHFPILPDFVVGEDAVEARKMELQQYLQDILHVHAYRDYYETAQFLEVGRLSFVYNLGKKHKEGLVKRRPGGKYARSVVRNFCITRFLAWKKSWLVIKDSYLAYVDPKEERIGDVILFDRLLKVRTRADKAEETEGIKKAVHLSNLQRQLLVKCETEEEANRWKTEIEHIANTEGSIWMENHPNDSAYPVRSDGYGHWFVDGKCFMEHAANIMEIAKEEIFITDWWLNPHIYMKRPATAEYWRLDEILQRKAMAGVRVFILVYREIAQVLPLGSQQMEEYMTKLSPNIKVLRHPDHVVAGVVSFAHHEKLIIIDQKVAFVGGIDLCYGRWDDHEHRLTDLGGLESCTFEGDDEFCGDVERMRIAYMEDGSPPESPAGKDNAKVPVKTNFAFDHPKCEVPKNGQDGMHEEPLDVFQILQRKRERMELLAANPIWRSRVRTLRDQLGDEYKETWVGKDYGNPLSKDLTEPEKAFDDYVDRSVIPRMPWHDISSVVYGKPARDVARHFIQRWNAAKLDLAQQNDEIPFLIPKTYENMGVPAVFRKMAMPCSVQVVRSSARWSAGIKDTEASIQNAYVKIISEAKHYIYIENQFFVSQIGGNDVHNKIAQALLDRIIRAHRDNETFRVYVLMPLLPGFTKESGSMQIVLHWTYASICKGTRSLLYNLESKIGDYSQYITFCGLRKHAQMLGRLVTELIYIHSKLIIADDRVCLIGSANINDRSQVGDRDSEVAVVMEDTQFTEATMNGQPYQAGVYAGSLRRRLFQEHLELMHTKEGEQPAVDVTDPTSQEFFDTWNGIAKSNAEIYDKVFKCAPSDDMTTLQEWAMMEASSNSLATTDKQEATKLLEGIRGHLVTFPLKFLSRADLYKDRFVPESLMPSYIFT